MLSKSICIFNPFDLCPPPYSKDEWMIQEVVFYCESQFWSAMWQMCLTSQDNLRWTQQCLWSELVGLTYTVGIAFLTPHLAICIIIHWHGLSFGSNSWCTHSHVVFGSGFLCWLSCSHLRWTLNWCWILPLRRENQVNWSIVIMCHGGMRPSWWTTRELHG